MSGTIIHIPTGKLIHENEDAASVERKMQSENAVLDILAPDGRSIFSIQKLVGEINNQGDSERRAA